MPAELAHLLRLVTFALRLDAVPGTPYANAGP